MNDMLLGAIALASIVAGLFFLRFWRATGDRFFLYFALSFGIEGLNRIHLGLAGGLREDDAVYYLIRLVAYGLILWAVLEKNLPRRRENG